LLYLTGFKRVPTKPNTDEGVDPMKKRCFILLPAFMIVAMMLSTASIAAPAPAKPVELKLGHAWATTHHVHVILDQWAKDVEKATDGRVKITI
jgi:TRAP-type C4-dicarboxylate transport system substrate-binding protein